MLRSFVLALALFAVGCADDAAPEEASGSVDGEVEVQSNETPNAEAPQMDAVADTTGPASVTVAGETVPTRAVVTDIESGDRACYLTLRTDGGGAETVSADYSVCDSNVIVGRRVQIDYEPSDVMAASCQGDPDCLETETVALAILARPID